MKKNRVLLSGVLIGALTLAGCAAEPEGGAPATEERSWDVTLELPAATGEVDRVDWGLASEPRSLDPARTSRHVPAEQIRANICDSLWRYAPDRSLQPALATEMTTSDGTTLVYSLREDVLFHDGSPLTATDVVASLSRHRDPALGSVLSGVFANVTAIEATGSHEVTITLSQPDYLFNQLLGGEAGRIESAAFLEQSGADYGSPSVGLNCTGPYVFEEWRTGSSVTLTRFEDYWDSSLPLLAASAQLYFPADTSARVSALTSGDLDGTYALANGANPSLSGASTGTLYFGPGTQTYSLIVNTEGVFADAAARSAFSKALDRIGLIQAGFAGYAAPARAVIGAPAWSALGAAASDLYAELPDTAVSDPEAATAAIGDLGLSGQTLVFAYLQGHAEMTAMGNAVLAAGDAVGMTVELRELAGPDFTALTSDPMAKDGIDLWPVAYRQASGDPLETYTSFTSDSALNYGRYVNSDFDAIAAEALRTEDNVRRAELTADLARIVAEELPWIPMVEPAYNLFLSNELTGVPTTAESLVPWLAWAGAAG